MEWPPKPSQAHFSQLTHDAKGRIWYTCTPQRSEKFGVIDGNQRILVDAQSLKFGPQPGLYLSVLYPIGDGTKVLAVDDQCVGGVLDVADGRIVSVEQTPVIVGDTPTGWRHNVLRDHVGQVWVMTLRRSENTEFIGHGGRSQCLGTDGQLRETHDGWLMLEDHEHGLWYFLSDPPRESAIVRHDSSGQAARLDIPGLRGILAEASDGTVWSMTSEELIRLKHSETQIEVVARHSLPDNVIDGVRCDLAGGVWLTRTPAIGSYHTEIEVRELIRFSTSPSMPR